ncbi:outer membrane protein assembly factor BamE [Acetobacter okinawensis]|uniref:outer membrane protein assembly factor BamE n=1 Tax=Acetobacter okinawensis TaxID=1076594 RepID=UPI0020A0BD36|nr:outer membrane protein assembly factor BamE [Acetobacter okinawensis]MCP1213789.1 outer membrane protein assembly factor BamE [Acetobacter okinawensis]
MKNVTLAGCLTALLALSACASSGNESIKNETGATIDQKIQDGVTTKDQVRAQFGDPMDTSFTDSGHEVWKYAFAKSKADGTNFIPYYGMFSSGSHGSEKQLSIIFNGNKVWHHSLSNSAVTSHGGISG